MGMDINGESQQVTEEKVWVVPKYGGGLKGCSQGLSGGKLELCGGKAEVERSGTIKPRSSGNGSNEKSH